MDTRPFLVFDLLNIQEALVDELKKLSKDAFDVEEMISAASELKYTREIKKILRDQLISPSDKFVKFLARQVYSGNVTETVREQFTDIVKRAFNQFVSEKINERLKSALAKEASSRAEPEEVEPEPEVTKEDRIETTEEELEAFYIVKSIMREVVDPSRVMYRDAINYFTILLDDNNRKRICRLYFNSPKRKYIGLADENKKEEKILIHSLNDIYEYSDKLKATASFYD